MILAILGALACLQGESALELIGDRYRHAGTISAHVETGAGRGTLHYRRDPARLVIRLEAKEIRIDADSYQVGEADRIDIRNDAVAQQLLRVFHPQGRGVRVSGSDRAVVLEPLTSGGFRSLTLHRDDQGALGRFEYSDPDGNRMEVRLTDVQLNPVEGAREALDRLSAKFRHALTLSARVVQTRRTALLDEPITSSGLLYYRRDPARLVFRMTEPRETEIHLDHDTYQVYRPAEKRLEVIRFEDDRMAEKMLMIFNPKTEGVEKRFKLHRSDADETIELRLEPIDEEAGRYFADLTLRIAKADGTLRRIAYADADGDKVEFELSELKINPELPGDSFELSPPEGTRVLKHALKREE